MAHAAFAAYLHSQAGARRCLARWLRQTLHNGWVRITDAAYRGHCRAISLAWRKRLLRSKAVRTWLATFASDLAARDATSRVLRRLRAR